MTESSTGASGVNKAVRGNLGFTLIELVIVIVILGILSAFALPRFADLGSDARRAKIEGAAGAMRSAASIVNSACRVRDDCDISAGEGGGNGLGNSIELEGEKVTLAFGYPRASETAGIVRAAKIRDVGVGGDYGIATFSAGQGGVRVRPDGDTTFNECEVRYIQPQSAGEAPAFEFDLGGC